MSPPNDRVPRRQPTIDEQLRAAVEGISRTARHMETLEDKALSGHYADRAQMQRGIGRNPEHEAKVAYTEKEAYASGLTTLGNGIGNTAPEWTPPHIRVIQAEQRVMEARRKLEALVDRICGPQPEDASAMAGEPNPWGGAAGETVNSAQRIKEEVDRIGTLLRVLETVVP